MQKIAKRIEIVNTNVPTLSCLGHKSSLAMLELLSAHYATVSITIVNNTEDLAALVARQPDLVFVGLKYLPGEQLGTKVWVADYLDQHGIEYSGSPRRAIEFEQDKSLAKQQVMGAGVQTSQHVVLAYDKDQEVTQAPFPFPLFLKPVGSGAGVGVDENSVVHNLDQLNAKVKSLAEDHGADALVETYLSGREFSVAILEKESTDDLMAMPLEFLPPPDAHGDRILSHATKTAKVATPFAAVVDLQLKEQLIELATHAFIALGGRDYGRIDIRLDALGVPHFLEANLIPCLTRDYGTFPRACKLNIGMEYDEMMLHIIRLALGHKPSETDIDRLPLHATLFGIPMPATV
ncbi:MAG TPA: D-alanine--D-alanine ligase [Patescibacteria group bacterium]|nr:D-alanine--D-alanine ligase [Patescibacteria group bacterium]